jgi:hypothetical protein
MFIKCYPDFVSCRNQINGIAFDSNKNCLPVFLRSHRWMAEETQSNFSRFQKGNYNGECARRNANT